jgi:hypothetical protein
MARPTPVLNHLLVLATRGANRLPPPRKLPRLIGAAGDQHRETQRYGTKKNGSPDTDEFGDTTHDDAADCDAGKAGEVNEGYWSAAPSELLFQRHEKNRHAVQDQPQTAGHNNGRGDDDDPAVSGLGSSERVHGGRGH